MCTTAAHYAHNDAARNRRLAESMFGRYSQRYVCAAWTIPAEGCCSKPVDLPGGDDLATMAAMVERLRAAGEYRSVNLYDRVNGRHVTRADVASVRA